MFNKNTKLIASFIAMLVAMAICGCNGYENFSPTQGTSTADTGSATVIPAMACNVLMQSADGTMIVCDGRLVCKDGKSFEAGWALSCASMVPSSGVKGDTGATGAAGKDGAGCTTAMDSKSCVVVTCGTTISAPICGGANGANGTNGVDGKDGKNGTNGTNGTDGVNGTNGKDGATGANGANGKDAQPCSVSLSADGCKVSIICPLSSVIYAVPCGSADAGSSDTSSADAGSTDAASADVAADITATDIAADTTVVAAFKADLSFISPVAAEIHVYYNVDQADPAKSSESSGLAPLAISLNIVQACLGFDGVDIAVRTPTAPMVWWCGIGDGTPSKSQIAVKVNGVLVAPTFQIEPQACSGGQEGNLHLSKAQLGCP